MRKLLHLVVALLLSGAASSAFATRYTWTVAGIPMSFATGSTDCLVVAERYSKVQQEYSRAFYSSNFYYYYEMGCGTGTVRSVGDFYHVGLRYVGPSVSSSVFGDVYLASIGEDDLADEIAHSSIQRVAVLVGSLLMFGVGFIGGKS